MPEATNGEVTLHFQDEGSGRPVLLIHGHTQDHRIWAPVAPILLAAGLRVLSPDLRGHGRSTRPEAGYHLTHHASDMVAVMDAAGVRSATVIGYSIGGGIALEMALSQPARVAGLVLVSPVMPDRSFEPAFMENLKQVARVARTEGIAAAMAGPWAENPLFAHSFTKPGIREAANTITRDFPGAEYLASSRDRVERSWTVPDRLDEIRMPVVVLAGERETPGFRAFAEEAAAGIPGARLEIYENCGHLVPLEEPDRLAAAIIDLASRSDTR
ncbi:MAG: alpha/beta fold hydrolase [Thermoanaerobaculales bacterium]